MFFRYIDFYYLFFRLFIYCLLFLFTGFTFDPIGLSLVHSASTRLLSSIFGIFGLSFLVMLYNTLFVRALLCRKYGSYTLTLMATLAIGSGLFFYHKEQKQLFDKEHTPFKILVVHTKTLPEELEVSKDLINDAFHRWLSLLKTCLINTQKQTDLILFPEIVVPFSSKAPLFQNPEMQQKLHSLFPGNEPLTSSHAIGKALAKKLQTPLLIGLEAKEENHYFNSAYFIQPDGRTKRYDKRVLLPMGEYIPCEWARTLAARYGLVGSFERGSQSQFFPLEGSFIYPSICYEDTFPLEHSDIKKIALLVNLTNDGWYPNSALGEVHSKLSSVRSLESGRPMVRSSNYGFSGVINSLGQSHFLNDAQIDGDIDARTLSVSKYTYTTLYAIWGNIPLLLFIVCSILFQKEKIIWPFNQH